MSPHTGVASYTRNLVQELNKLRGIEPHLFYGFSWSQTLRAEAIPGLDSARTVIRRFIPNSYELNRLVQQFYFSRGAKKLKPEIYHDPSFLPFRFRGPVVVTVHDLSPIRYPETHPSSRVRAIMKYLPAAVRESDQVIVDSEFIKCEVVDHFGVDTKKVRAIHLGVSEDYYPRSAQELTPAL